MATMADLIPVYQRGVNPLAYTAGQPVPTFTDQQFTGGNAQQMLRNLEIQAANALAQQYSPELASPVAAIVPAPAVTASEASVDTRANPTHPFRAEVDEQDINTLRPQSQYPVAERRNVPLRPEDDNPYFRAMVALYQTKRKADPNWDEKSDPVYQAYVANWHKSLQKGAGYVRGVNPYPDQPAPPPAPAPTGPITPTEPVSWVEPRPVPGYGQAPALNTQLTRLPCVDGNCGPAYNGREGLVGTPRMSILGAYALADILKEGNASVNAANQHYDQMAVQQYANDPTFQQDIAIGVQRGLTPEAAYHAAVARRGYAAGNNNLANATYTQQVLPDETRNAELQISMADSYGVPYQAQPDVLGNVLPLGGVYSISPNADGTRNFETANFGFFNAPRDAASQFSQLHRSDDPVGAALGIQRQEQDEAFKFAQDSYEREHRGTVAADKSADAYLKSVIDRRVGDLKDDKGKSILGGKGFSELNPKDQQLALKYMHDARLSAIKANNAEATQELDLAIRQAELKYKEALIEKTQREASGVSSLTGSVNPALVLP